MRKWSLVALVYLIPCTMFAQTAPAKKVHATFNHLEPTPKIFDLELNDRQTFTVRISNTCPDAFEYSFVGVERAPELQGAAKKPLVDKDIDIPYDARFGGYAFTIALKPGADPASVCESGDKLKSTSFIVSVRQSEWGLSFSGGFTISGLTNKVFAIKTENGVKKVIEEPDKADERKLGAASFVHVFHDRAAWKGLQPALGFGLGISGDNKAEYLIGAGLRLGDKATLNLGWAWGSISRLPNGVTFDTPIADDNVLNNLGTQVVRRVFVGLSYSFIDTKERLLKPFASDQKTTTPAAATPESGSKPGALSGGIVDSFKAIAGTVATYKGNADVSAALGDTSICSADASDAGGKTVSVMVHLKGASEAQLAKLKSLGKAAAESVNAAVAKLITLKPAPQVKDAVAFDSKCS